MAEDKPHPLLEQLAGYASDVADDFAGLRFEELAAEEHPLASFADGLAGVAFSLWHLSRVKKLPSALAAAKRLVCDALANAEDERAFESGDPDCDPGSVMFGRGGLDWVATLVGESTNALTFAKPTQRPADLYFGRAGQLIASLMANDDFALANRLADELFGDVVGEESAFHALEYTGLAHGFGGAYLAVLLWCRETGASPPTWLAPSIRKLAAMGPPWPMTTNGGDPVGGFCQGAAGLVQVFVLAHEVLDDASLRAAAINAAGVVAEKAAPMPTLCCGSIGESYAMLAISRIDDSPRWMQLAFERAAIGLANEQLSLGMLHGEAAALCLAIDLEAGRTSLPFFARS